MPVQHSACLRVVYLGSILAVVAAYQPDLSAVAEVFATGELKIF